MWRAEAHQTAGALAGRLQSPGELRSCFLRAAKDGGPLRQWRFYKNATCALCASEIVPAAAKADKVRHPAGFSIRWKLAGLPPLLLLTGCREKILQNGDGVLIKTPIAFSSILQRVEGSARWLGVPTPSGSLTSSAGRRVKTRPRGTTLLASAPHSLRMAQPPSAKCRRRGRSQTSG